MSRFDIQSVGGYTFCVKNLKVYLDTSVISFLFATDSPDFRRITESFFTSYSNAYQLFISDIVLLELNKSTDGALRQKMLDVAFRSDISKLKVIFPQETRHG